MSYTWLEKTIQFPFEQFPLDLHLWLINTMSKPVFLKFIPLSEAPTFPNTVQNKSLS